MAKDDPRNGNRTASANVYYLYKPTKCPREGSQARSKATDSRSVLAGVPRFKSGPSHILILSDRLMFKTLAGGRGHRRPYRWLHSGRRSRGGATETV